MMQLTPGWPSSWAPLRGQPSWLWGVSVTLRAETQVSNEAALTREREVSEKCREVKELAAVRGFTRDWRWMGGKRKLVMFGGESG